MKKALLLLWITLFFTGIAFAQANQDEANQKLVRYPFWVQDAPARLFTMRQVNQDYLSGFRLLADVANDNLRPTLSYLFQSGLCLFAFTTMTHEEAHRSILLVKNIGAITQPFFLSKRGGYVEGVTDQTLKHMRDADLPSYIRLHTAGFESDYMLTHREETLLAFEGDSFKNLAVEYYFRKATVMQHFLMGIFKINIDGAEETNELQRDIVGSDLYGAIRHLHRPEMEFRRYTRYEDLTPTEKQFVRRLGFRVFLNLLNTNLAGMKNFKIGDHWKINVGMGHTMSPFGDFIEEKLWLTDTKKWRISGYLREYQNRDQWFFASGLGVEDYPLIPRLDLSLMMHYWKQPLNLSFTERNGKTGGAIDLVGKYRLWRHPSSYFRSISLDLGASYKTAGFLPEDVYMRKHFAWRMGLTLNHGLH